MSWELLAALALKSVLVAGLALLLLHLLRRRSAAERSWIAHAGLAATLLLPLLALAGPRWEVAAPAPVAAYAAAPLADMAAPAAPGTGIGPAPTFDLSAAPPPAAAGIARPSLPFLAWAVPALLLLLVTLVAVVRLHVLRARAQVLVEQDWLTALARAQRRMGFKHGTALLVSDELSSPVSWGILRPIILLNEAAVGSRGQAEAIIAHELAHVARLDWAKLLLARAAVALFWFNPLVWLLARQCHQLREEAADDAVLSSDVCDTDYAALLVGAARHESNGLLLAANGVAPGRGSLKRRVARVLDSGLNRRPARIAWSSACAAGAVLVAAPLAALTPVAALPEAAVAPVAAAMPASAPTASPSVSATAPVPAQAPAPAAEAALPVPASAVAAEASPAPAPRGASGAYLELPRFSGLDLVGGGHVVIRHGAAQSVRLIGADASAANIAVNGGRLAISPCTAPCGAQGLRVEIVTPALDAVAVKGGGMIVAESGFPAQGALAVAIEGGGTVDLRGLRARRVAAAVLGGGVIMTRAEDALMASINGGGEISYWGDPQVMSSVQGGGAVSRGGGN
ncbi:MAG: M56 family metallopeptidase [Allosphingosinicella sp.]|uniref:M56 family metallopeptidase n=1 Tax=Allosphingosinicella sp. TaxID=2823234 RepID=UPI00393942C8